MYKSTYFENFVGLYNWAVDQKHFLDNVHRTLSFVQKQLDRMQLNGTKCCGFDMFFKDFF